MAAQKGKKKLNKLIIAQKKSKKKKKKKNQQKILCTFECLLTQNPSNQNSQIS